ncbi:MAG: single-stranded-DNA-specific exonuclease RecJ [Sphingobacteriales bacterium]|nr:single-stranded-DNA-specific exonuclease RecJ [Sphingobacteriales bacterium]
MVLKKRWIGKPLPSRQEAERLKNQLNSGIIEAVLLLQRGITTVEEAKHYFNPSLLTLHDPFLMKNMEKAVSRLHQAISSHEKILIYGDYDVDGTTAVSIMYKYLSSFYPHVRYYVPDRFSEGYGISKDGVDFAEKNGISLIIALDCGIKEIENAEYSRSLGIDMIICDHHNPGNNIPNAYAVLNPKQADCPYPYKELSGCGVGFKLIQAYENQYNTNFDIFSLLDYVAVSIASDIVPMTGENRALCFLGLEKLNTLPSIPFQAMLNILKPGHKMDVNDLVFLIGPRLNASGRISHASITVEFLISKTLAEAGKFFQEINTNNTERQDIDLHTLEEAKMMIDNDESLKNAKTTVLFHPGWHKGVIGIVASRLIDYYYRPTILLTETDGQLTGSARSIPGFDLYSALEKCREYLDKFGGHQFAAGLSLDKNMLDLFRNRFEQVVSESITDEMLIPMVEYDLELRPEHISLNLIDIVEKFAPFGPENMKPRFVLRKMKCAEEPRIVGNNHLRFAIRCNGSRISCIAFGMGDLLKKISKYEFDICFYIEKNIWNGNTYIQLNIKDIHIVQ